MHTITPESVGFSSGRLSRISVAMQRYIDEGELAGIIALVARRNQIAYVETFGHQNIEAQQLMQLDTIFRIYSMTKPIVSIAMMMLYETGHFHLSDPVTKFIPAFKKLRVLTEPGFTRQNLVEPQRPMTIRDLFIHTAGLSYGFFEDSPVDTMYRELKPLSRDLTLAEMVDVLAEIPLAHHPGTAWRYSIATDVLGYLVELLADMPLDTFLQEKLFQPLGMIDTGFHVPEASVGRFATCYRAAEDERKLKVVDDAATSEYLTPPRKHSGGGGLVGTAADYLNFAQMLLNGGEFNDTRFISRKSLELMTVNHVPQALFPLGIGPSILAGQGFGLGFRVMMSPAEAQIIGSVGEYGWAGAANTHFWVDSQEMMIGILMTQIMPSDQTAVVPDLRVGAYQAIID